MNKETVFIIGFVFLRGLLTISYFQQQAGGTHVSSSLANLSPRVWIAPATSSPR